MIRVEMNEDDLPRGFWQSVECPLCGAPAGEYCTYNDDRVAHTRHGVRDVEVLSAAKARALAPDVIGEPINGNAQSKTKAQTLTPVKQAVRRLGGHTGIKW